MQLSKRVGGVGFICMTHVLGCVGEKMQVVRKIYMYNQV